MLYREHARALRGKQILAEVPGKLKFLENPNWNFPIRPPEFTHQKLSYSQTTVALS
jgi:hypothetical protein